MTLYTGIGARARLAVLLLWPLGFVGVWVLLVGSALALALALMPSGCAWCPCGRGSRGGGGGVEGIVGLMRAPVDV